MAEDTRIPSAKAQEGLSKEALTVDKNTKAFSGSQWQDGSASTYRPPENANMMAGGTEHTAGGKVPDVTLSNAFKDGLKWRDFEELPKKPCVRDALLVGIGAGFGMGGVRAIFGAAVFNACSWAAGSFCFSAPIMYNYCHYTRQKEKEGMMRAVEILNRKDLEKKAREQRREKAREERRAAKEAEQDAQFAALNQAAGGRSEGKPWWKIW